MINFFFFFVLMKMENLGMNGNGIEFYLF